MAIMTLRDASFTSSRLEVSALRFMIAFALYTRVSRTGESSLLLPLGLASLAGVAVAAWGTFRIWRRQDDAALMQAGTLGFVSLMSIYQKVYAILYLLGVIGILLAGGISASVVLPAPKGRVSSP